MVITGLGALDNPGADTVSLTRWLLSFPGLLRLRLRPLGESQDGSQTRQ